MPDKKEKTWRSFEEAREYARSLGLQSHCEWMNFIDGQYIKLGRKPFDIPDNPVAVYKFEWQGWNDWLVAVNILFRRSKTPVKAVRRNNLKQKKYRPVEKTCKTTGTEDSPSKPIASNSFCSFEEARKYARKLGLVSHYEWNRFVCKHLKTMPSKIPLNPAAIYRFEWKGWRDWLGTA